VIDINSLPAVENCRWIMTGRQSMPYLGNVIIGENLKNVNIS
jgi:hypothetical protein